MGASGRTGDFKVSLFFLIGMVLILSFCAPSMAVTWTVCDSGCNFTNIQDAINAADEGDTIEIRSGDYGGPVVVNRSLTLRGIDTGTGYPVIDAEGAEFGITLEALNTELISMNITGANSSAVLIENNNCALLDLTIVHPKVTDYYLTYPAVTGENVAGLTISSCRFYVHGDTVVLYDPHGYSITGNEFNNPYGYSVAVVSSGSANPTEDGIISGNTITQSRGAGIGIIARTAGGLVRNLTVSDNLISGSGGSIGLFIPSEEVVIRNNTLSENPGTPRKGIYGIMTYGTSGVVVADNHVAGTDVELAYRFEDCSGLTITGNTVDTNSDTGMGFLWVTDSFVSQNTMDNNIYNFWMNPFVLDPGVLPGNVIDTTNLADGKPVWYFEGVDDLSIDSSDTLATVILYGCDNAEIRDLSSSANGAGVMALRSENLTVTNGSFDQMYRGILSIASPHLTIQGNHLTDCSDGIMVGDFYGGLISDNLVENSEDCGIVTGIYLEDVTIRDNTIDGAHAGIYLDKVSGFNNAVFTANTIQRTLVAGISSSESEGAILSGNTINAESGVGFDLTVSSSLNLTGNTLTGDAENGVFLLNSPENTIMSNFLTATKNGIVLQRRIQDEGSYDNLIADNLVTSDTSILFCLRGGVGDVGILPKFGSDPVTPASEISHTVLIARDSFTDPVGLSYNPDPNPPANTWNTTMLFSPNIAGGPYLGGNYWANADGTGWSQVTPDRGDGFCVSPLAYDLNNIDHLPLHLFEGEIPITAPAVIDRPGQYRLMNDLVNSTAGTAISIKASDVILNGDGHIIEGSNVSDTHGVLAGGGGESYKNITIRNLTASHWAYGFNVNGVKKSWLYNCTAVGNMEGISISAATYCTVERSTIQDNIPWESEGIWYGGNGLGVTNSTDTWVLESVIGHNGWGEQLPYVGGSGILSTENLGLFVSGCHIDENVNTGIWSDHSIGNILIGNQFTKNGGNGGIFMTSPVDDPEIFSIIRENTIAGSGFGIWLTRDDHYVSKNTVTDCGYGIFLDNAHNATLSGNLMSDNEVNFCVDGTDIGNFYHQVDTTNTINGRPIYYLVEETGAVVDGASLAGTVFGIACPNLTVNDLMFEKNEYGLFLFMCDDATIRNVTATGSYYGFFVRESDRVRIDRCTARENIFNGFHIQDSEGVRVTSSEASTSRDPFSGSGFGIQNCKDIHLHHLIARSNSFAGIDLEETNEAWLLNITAESNGAAGIILGGDSLYLEGSQIRDTEGPGIGMLDASNVYIWNNYLSNDENVDLSGGVVTNVTWNARKIAGTNIVGGPYLGGNYWANADGTGWSQVTPDRGDGFCNAPYVIDENNIDSLPLHIRTEPPFYADFNATPLSGNSPLAVQFADQSDGRIVSYLYKFGDGYSSTNRNPLHTYRKPGTYTVSLTIRTIEGRTLVSKTMTKEAYIRVEGTPGPDIRADFTATPATGSAPLQVVFSGTSTMSPIMWRYDFGDGYRSSSQNPSHIFRKPGTYTVSLTVWAFGPDRRLITNTTTHTDIITVL